MAETMANESSVVEEALANESSVVEEAFKKIERTSVSWSVLPVTPVREVASEMDQSSIEQEKTSVDLPFEQFKPKPAPVGCIFPKSPNISEEPAPVGCLFDEPPIIPEERQQHHDVEDEVTIEMEKMIQGCGDGGFPPECCIYRVPIVLRKLNPEAYIPNLVSIGPFHYGNMRLADMERHKKILFKKFTQRAKSSLDDLVRCVKDLEPKVRASYADTIDLTEQELVKLALVDAAFIIEFFNMQKYREIHKDDVTVSQPWLANSILLDFILLENQLPFFVIEELFNKTLPHAGRGSPSSFISLACKFYGLDGQKLESNSEVEIKHFTDLIRWSYLEGKMRPSKAQKPILRYNANALQEAGINFKVREERSLLDLNFSRHTLEIPRIDVEDCTGILFRNMIALEQCHYPHASYITDYTAVMEWLIDTSKDVDILIHNNIIRNNLSDSNSVASLFNGLGENVIRSSFNTEYLQICEKLNGYCQNRWHKTKATLRRDYCNTPWRTVASIAAIILLLLTITQTIFSVLQVY